MSNDKNLLQELRALVKDGQETEAVQRMQEDDFKNAKSFGLNLMCARVFFRAGEFQHANDALEQAEANGAPEDAVLKLRYLLQQKTGDRKGLAHSLERMAELEPDDGTRFAKLSDIHLRANDIVAAEYAANRALEINPALPLAHAALYNAVLVSSLPLRVGDVLATAIKDAAQFPNFQQLTLTLGEIDQSKVKQLSNELAKRWPEDVICIDGVAYSAVLKNETVDSLRKSAINLALLGKKDEAIAMAKSSQIAATDNLIPRVRGEIVETIKMIPGPDERCRELVVENGEEVTCSSATKSGVTVMFFTGLAGRVKGNNTILDAFFAKAGFSAIYLRDFSRNLYNTGLVCAGGGRDNAHAYLHDQLEKLGTQQLIVMGSSAGGFAAIRYGIELKAHRILSFSGPTAIDDANLEAFGDIRRRMTAGRFQNSFTPDDMDLKSLVAKAQIPGGISLYFGEKNAIDKAHAQYLQNLPSVKLQPIADFASHKTLEALLNAGTLMEEFNIDIGCEKN